MTSNSSEYNLFDVLTRLYFQLYPEAEQIPFQVRLTNNLNRTHGELRPDWADELKENDRENDFNGRMVVPNSVNEPINILLNTKKIKEYTDDRSMTWVGTFAHELTHAIDFYQMARKEKLKSYKPLEASNDYYMFQQWTEYNARKKGYFFLRKYFETIGQMPSSTEQINHIQNKEWPFQLTRYCEEYQINNNDGKYQIYITMQLLGRYSVWCDLFPDVFNKQSLSSSFQESGWMIHLFTFLREHETLDAVYTCFDEMKEILMENWG